MFINNSFFSFTSFWILYKWNHLCVFLCDFLYSLNIFLMASTLLYYTHVAYLFIFATVGYYFYEYEYATNHLFYYWWIFFPSVFLMYYYAVLISLYMSRGTYVKDLTSGSKWVFLYSVSSSFPLPHPVPSLSSSSSSRMQGKWMQRNRDFSALFL